MEIKLNIEPMPDREDFFYFELAGNYYTIMSDKHYYYPSDKTKGKVQLMSSPSLEGGGDGNWDWTIVEDVSDLTIFQLNILNSALKRLFQRKIDIGEDMLQRRGIKLQYA
tara:strand:+ start:27 stop:356 length:330 start_codon:yes stop_codon:yes gene_type:complete